MRIPANERTAYFRIIPHDAPPEVSGSLINRRPTEKETIMVVHYNDSHGDLTVHVPNGINPFWTKYMLRSILARRGYTRYGTWVEFSRD